MFTFDMYMTKIKVLYPKNTYCLNCAREIKNKGYEPFCSTECAHRAYRLENDRQNYDLVLLCTNCGKAKKLKDDTRGLCEECLAIKEE